jgi:sec-independent protein translocase protein TatA
MKRDCPQPGAEAPCILPAAPKLRRQTPEDCLMGVFDWKHWIVILIVVVLVFGTKKLKGLGSDVGESIKGFRKAMNDEETESTDEHRSAKNSLQNPAVRAPQEQDRR